jgi:hypothetical protein
MVLGRMLGADQREAHPYQQDRAFHSLESVNPSALWSCFSLHFLHRWQANRRSVAILPSALVIEHLCSVPVGRFSFQWVLPPEYRSLLFRLAEQEPE